MPKSLVFGWERRGGNPQLEVYTFTDTSCFPIFLCLSSWEWSVLMISTSSSALAYFTLCLCLPTAPANSAPQERVLITTHLSQAMLCFGTFPHHPLLPSLHGSLLLVLCLPRGPFLACLPLPLVSPYVTGVCNSLGTCVDVPMPSKSQGCLSWVDCVFHKAWRMLVAFFLVCE